MEGIDFAAIHAAEITDESIARTEARTAEAAAALTRKIQKYESKIVDARDRFVREGQSMIAAAEPGDQRSAVKQLVARDVDRKTSALRRTMVKSSEAELRDLLGALQKHTDTVDTHAALCSSPAQMLGRVGLGTERRTHLQRQLAGAGKAELRSSATLAVATGDTVLAAAVLTVVDRPSSGQRPFSPAAFAAAVMGEQHARVQSQIAEVRSRARAARDLHREFLRGSTDPNSKIARGIAARRATGE